ncbi:hypothetical protein M1446_04495 [Candidatus Dependentiae bacterium]|nr:hypothetical protein [Candidatus Dependentiae bacterium]
MTNKLKIFLALAILLHLNTKCNHMLAVKKIFKVAMHWVLSAGPQFADAIYHVALLSDDYAQEIFGTENADFFTQNFIRRILEECGIDNADIIEVKIIKQEAQKFIVSAITCTQTAIFLNSSIFDYLSKSEQRNLIAQAAVLLKRKHIEKNAIALSVIPIITYMATEAYVMLCEYIYNKLPNKDGYWPTKIKQGNEYIARFWATKLAINSMLAALYFKYQNIQVKKFAMNS